MAYLRYPRTRLDHQPVRREQRLRHSWHARSSARECGCARQQRWDQLQLLHKYKCETQIRNGRERGKDTPKRRLMACVWPKLQAACKALLPSLPACRQLTSTPGSLSSQFSSRMTPALAARHKRVLMAVLASCCILYDQAASSYSYCSFAATIAVFKTPFQTSGLHNLRIASRTAAAAALAATTFYDFSGGARCLNFCTAFLFEKCFRIRKQKSLGPGVMK